MKNEQKTDISLEKYFSGILHFVTFSENSVISRKEIENYLIKNEICKNRLVTDILESMVSRQYLVREKLKGSKRMGYAINEEIISKSNESYFTTGVKKNGFPIYKKITQKELNKEIKHMISEYRKIIGNKKSEIHTDNVLFYLAHTTFLTLSLSWISRLILSIHGGVFHDKEMKISLARKNIELLETFIKSICVHTREKDPDNYDMFLTSMLNFFEYLDPYEGTPYSTMTKEPSSLMR